MIPFQLIALWLEFGIAERANSYAWRLPLALQAGLALFLSALLFVMPECKLYLYPMDLKSEFSDWDFQTSTPLVTTK